MTDTPPDKLKLAPDPQDENVWENMRRIASWADAVAQQETDWAARFLAMGT